MSQHPSSGSWAFNALINFGALEQLLDQVMCKIVVRLIESAIWA